MSLRFVPTRTQGSSRPVPHSPRTITPSIAALVAILTFLPGLCRGAQPLVSSPYLIFEAGNRQQAVLVSAGDLDLDGKPDLVTIGAQKSVLLNQGGGMFGAPLAFFPCASAPITIADLNHDGRPDLASVGGQGVCVSHGLGNGTFDPSESYATRIGAQSGAVTDLNGDGWLDFIVTYRAEGFVSVLPGRPDGIFIVTAESPVPVGSKHLALGDFNGDSRQDVAVSVAESSAVYVLLAAEGNTFVSGPKVAVGPEPIDLRVGDFDADGNLDVATLSTTFGSVSTLLGNGHGMLSHRRDNAVGTRPLSIVAADWNRDGRTDLAVANNMEATEFNGSISILTAGPGGSLSRSDLPINTDVRSLAVSDLNGDGIPDLAAGLAYATDVAVLIGNGDGTFGTWNHVTVAADGVAMVLANVNHDRRPDLIIANRIPGVLSVLLGRGDGSFRRVSDVPLSMPWSDQPIGLTSGDWDGDRNDDVAFTHNIGVATLRSKGDGSFTAPTSYPVGLRPVAISGADVDGDGRSDLLVANPNRSALSVLLGRGDGTFAPQIDTPVGPIAQGALALADFNRDGRSDVALCRADFHGPGYVSILLGNGDGTFRAPVDIPTSPGELPQHVATGDLNSDGKTDLVTTNTLGSTLMVLLGNGDGTFQRAPTISMFLMRGAEGVQILDMNEDGTPDLVIGSNGALRIRYGNGDGTFRLGEGYGTVQSPTEIVVGLLNGDCEPDLATLGRASPPTLSAEVTIFLRHPKARRPALAASRGNRVLPIGNGPPMLCIDVQSSGGSFDLRDIVPESITMVSQRSGSLTSIPGTIGKTGHVGHDGLPELQVCYAREDLALLLGDIQGRRTVNVSIEGCLSDGEGFAAPLALDVRGPNRAATTASVSPNPLNPHGVLRYVTTRSGPVRIRAYDLTGRLVVTLANEPLVLAGAHEISIDTGGPAGGTLSSGVYFYRIETADGVREGRFTILK